MIEKTKCDKSEVDKKIVFSFIDSCIDPPPYIELILPDTVPDGWRLDPHTKPLKVNYMLVQLLILITITDNTV